MHWNHDIRRMCPLTLQDTTDLHKCVQLALRMAADRSLAPPLRLVAVGALGGRLDHQLGALSLLHAFPGADITLLGVDATATLLWPGTHRLRRWTAAQEPTCGLVPLGACGGRLMA
jgi:thiamine pyrophosphokinase